MLLLVNHKQAWKLTEIDPSQVRLDLQTLPIACKSGGMAMAPAVGDHKGPERPLLQLCRLHLFTLAQPASEFGSDIQRFESFLPRVKQEFRIMVALHQRKAENYLKLL